MTEIYLLKTEKITKEYFQFLQKFISKERNENIERLKNVNKQIQSLYVELLLRAVLLQKYNVLNTAIVLKHNQFGRLETNLSTYNFSISHTYGLVAVAIEHRLGKGGVGIDIENPRKLGVNHIGRVCTKKQMEYVDYPNNGWNDRLLMVWTKKEAYLKSVGTGFDRRPDEIEFPDAEEENNLFSFIFEDYIISVRSPSGKYVVIKPQQSSVLVREFIEKHRCLYNL